MSIIPYAIVFFFYVIGEVIWLTLMSSHYSRWFSAYNPTLKIYSMSAFFLTYIVILGSFAYLVLSRKVATNLEAFLLGATFGLVVYCTYNGVNKATLPKYQWTMVIVDTLWGTLWFGLLSLLFHQAKRLTS